MPTTRRSRVVAAPPGTVWRTAGDPAQLPRWWPRVVRVEGVDARGFTEVLTTESGRQVRADFAVLERREGDLLRFAQDVEETPFARILVTAETTIRLTPDGDGATRVTLEQRQRLRGVAALGGLMVRRATRRVLEAALDGLEEVHGRAG